MGEHNQLKYAVDITRGLKRIFGLGDDEQGTTRLSETLQPGFGLYDRSELLFPIGINRWAVNPSQAAVAAQFQQVGIRNQPNSGFLVAIDYIEILTDSANQWEERIAANSVVGSVGLPIQTDLRVGNFPNPGLVTQSLTNTAVARLGSLVATHALALNAWNVYQPGGTGILLTPGFDFFVGANIVNLRVQVNFFGREWRANPGELLQS